MFSNALKPGNIFDMFLMFTIMSLAIFMGSSLFEDSDNFLVEKRRFTTPLLIIRLSEGAKVPGTIKRSE